MDVTPTKVLHMDNTGEVLQAISIGFTVACFLVITERAVKAIELWKECLFILKMKSGLIDAKIAESFYKGIYLEMVEAYGLINDCTNAIKHAVKVLHIFCKCGDRLEECDLSIKIAKLCLRQSKYPEAKDFCEKALVISKETGVRKGEASCYRLLGTVYRSFGEYGKAREFYSMALAISKETGDRNGEASCYEHLGAVYKSFGENEKSREYHSKALEINIGTGNRIGEASCYGQLGAVYESVGEHEKARDYLEKSLAISEKIGDRNLKASCYENLGIVYLKVGEYEKSREYHSKALEISIGTGDRNGEACCYLNLGNVYRSVGEYEKARKHLEKSLAISNEIGDRAGEAGCYGNLGAVYSSVGENKKAIKHLEKSLAILKQIGNRNGEASCSCQLGSVYALVGEYDKAKEHLVKSLAIQKEVGDKNGEGNCQGRLGEVYRLLGEYENAKEHLGKSLAISRDIGDKKGEACFNSELGAVYRSVGDYEKAKQYFEKSLTITKEMGDRHGVGCCYGNLGTVYLLVGEPEKARKHLAKSLSIHKEIGNRNEEAACYLSLGTLYQSVGKYEKAREHLEKSLVIKKEIGDRKGEASCYISLGNTYQSVGEYEQAKKEYEKALQIDKEIGDRDGVASCHQNIGNVLYHVGKFAEANEYYQKGLVITREIGARRGEAHYYESQGAVLASIGDYDEAKEYLAKALEIRKEIKDSEGEASCYSNLGNVFLNLGEYVKAEEHIKNGLAISEENKNITAQFQSLCRLADVKLLQGNIKEAFSYLLQGVQKCEDLRGSLRDNDHFKISFSDKHIESYQKLSALFSATGNPSHALYVLELGRASALADLMSTLYSAKKHISANPQTWAGIEKVMDKERNCACLYVSYVSDRIFLWIVKASGVMRFFNLNGNEVIAQEGLAGTLNDFLGSKSFRRFGILPKELCEDRSLDCLQPESKSCEEDSHEGSRIGKETKHIEGPKMNLPLCFKLIIAPVVDFLEDPEIIIVPDRSLYNIPFAALPDESGKSISESFRIRLVPSLTTLKLIHDSPAYYHSQTGALIVGNPDVGNVLFKGRLKHVSRLPCAENEAKMVAEKLSVKPLLGQQATKQAVLEVINSVSLIHFAAHGDAERGEIALAPCLRFPNRTPLEDDYLLTMYDISKVQLRAKLVVLSCCHSARGRIRAEGAVGIARAFLGSGARSVLVALWALEDCATEQLMSRFYDHLVRGESASESLHEAMKWMRSNGYSKVSQWAPFILIGDDVAFNFGK